MDNALIEKSLRRLDFPLSALMTYPQVLANKNKLENKFEEVKNPGLY